MICLVANASLKTQHDECILTPMQLYEWATENIRVIHFFYISPENVNASSSNFVLISVTPLGASLMELDHSIVLSQCL